VSALSDWRAAVIARVGTISGYAEAPGGDPTQIPEHWAAGFIVDMPGLDVSGDGGVVVARGTLTISLFYRRDSLAWEQGEWLTAWEQVRDTLEDPAWTAGTPGVLTVTGAASEVDGDTFVGRVIADWTLTYTR
jgi:hypothetical protein